MMKSYYLCLTNISSDKIVDVVYEEIFIKSANHISQTKMDT